MLAEMNPKQQTQYLTKTAQNGKYKV